MRYMDIEFCTCRGLDLVVSDEEIWLEEKTPAANVWIGLGEGGCVACD